MEDFISADPCTFDHASLFKVLQNLTLEYRLNDPYCSLVMTKELAGLKGIINHKNVSGMVQPGASFCLGRILRKVRSKRLLQTSLLFVRSPRQSREKHHDRSDVDPLQLRFLC